MKLPFVRAQPEVEPTDPFAVGAQVRRSRAFAASIDWLKNRPKRRVLDFGSACGENVEFFSKVGCQLEILDLYPQLVERPDRLARTHESFAIEHLINNILEQRPGKSDERPTFELLLTWDLFDFLSAEQIRGLIEGIKPYTADGTRLMTQVSFLGTVPDSPRQVRIQDAENLLVTAAGGHRSSPRYTEPALLKVMPGWEVDCCFLQRDGFREYVFVRR